MPRTLKALEGVRDDRGRLGRLFIVGGSELYVLFFGVEDTVDGGSPQPLGAIEVERGVCLLYTSPSPRDATLSRMPSSA